MVKRRNRRRRAEARALPVKLVGVLIVLAFFGICHVLFGTMSASLGEQIKKLEEANDDHSYRLRTEQSEWARVTTAEQIECALLRHGLNMALQRGEQLVHLRQGSGDGGYRTTSQLASRR